MIDYDKLVNSFYGCVGNISSPIWIFGKEWRSANTDDSVNFMNSIIPFNLGWELPQDLGTNKQLCDCWNQINSCVGDFYERTQTILDGVGITHPMKFNLFPLPLPYHNNTEFNNVRIRLGWDTTCNLADYEKQCINKFRSKLPTLLKHSPNTVHAIFMWGTMANKFRECFDITQTDNPDEWDKVRGIDGNRWIWHGCQEIADKKIILWTADWTTHRNQNKTIAEQIAELIKKFPA